MKNFSEMSIRERLVRARSLLTRPSRAVFGDGRYDKDGRRLISDSETFALQYYGPNEQLPLRHWNFGEDKATELAGSNGAVVIVPVV